MIYNELIVGAKYVSVTGKTYVLTRIENAICWFVNESGEVTFFLKQYAILFRRIDDE